MIDTAALKNRILALAMCGQIANNKKDVKQLFDSLCDNAFKIDKNKVLEENYDLSELPFEIPDNWKWVWLGDIFQHNTGKALNSSNMEGVSLEYITTSNLYWDRFELDELKTMLFKDSEIEKCTVKKGDLLICEGGDIGRSAIWSEDYEMRIQNHIHRLRPYVDDICVRFYYYVMMYYKNNGLISGRGIGLQGLSSKRLHSILVPLPDIEIQCLIAEKIDESFSVIDTIDELQRQYSLDLEVLKSKIIDAGIQGKLTEQLPEDGTAEALLKQIAEKKNLLIKENKIKVTKALPEITKDEIPFEIPDNWKWVRLGDICRKIVDGDHNPPSGVKEKTEYLMLSAQNINDNKLVDIDKARYLDKVTFIEENKRTQLEKGDVLLTIVATLGRSCVYREEYNICFQRSVCVITTMINPDYLKRYLDCTYIQKYMVNNATGAAQPGFYLNKVERLLIPLPPLDEQGRIAERLSEIIQLIQ